VAGEVQEIQLTGITQVKAKPEAHRRRLVRSEIKVSNIRLTGDE
jgi:hypothetical protein